MKLSKRWPSCPFRSTDTCKYMSVFPSYNTEMYSSGHADTTVCTAEISSAFGDPTICFADFKKTECGVEEWGWQRHREKDRGETGQVCSCSKSSWVDPFELLMKWIPPEHLREEVPDTGTHTYMLMCYPSPSPARRSLSSVCKCLWTYVQADPCRHNTLTYMRA